MNKKRFLVIFIVSFLFLITIGYTRTVSQKEATIEESDFAQSLTDAAEAEIDNLQDKLDEAESQTPTAKIEIEGLQAELEETQNQIVVAKAQIEELQAELEEAQSQTAVAEAQIESMESGLEDALNRTAVAEASEQSLTEKVTQASDAAEILNVFFTLGLSRDEVKETNAIALFLDLNEKIQKSEDEVLKEKFQAALLSENLDDQEMIDFFQYLLEIIVQLAPENHLAE